MVHRPNLSRERERTSQRPTGMKRVPSWMLAVSLVSVMLVAGCSSQPGIVQVDASGDGMTLVFMMESCNGDYTVAVDEDSEQVRVGITDQRRRSPLGGDDCSSPAGPIQLEQPLEQRVIFDTVHDVELPVTYSPWNQTRYSEAEYLAAVEAAGMCVQEASPGAVVTIETHPDGYPDLSVEWPDLGDGERSTKNSFSDCNDQHVEPLRH